MVRNGGGQWIDDLFERVLADLRPNYASRPLPDLFDAALITLVEARRMGWAASGDIPDKFYDTLLAFSDRMSSCCLRFREPRFLNYAAASLDFAITGPDIRMVYVSLALLLDSYNRLPPSRRHIDTTGLPDFDREWLLFQDRAERDASIQAMGYAIETDNDGPRYVCKW